jgi:HlyD family secretion protein
LYPDAALRVGLSAEIKVHNEEAKNAVTISMNALHFDSNNEPYVLIQNSEGKAVSKKVTTGMNDGTSVEIKDGLAAGDTVLIEKQSNANSSASSAPMPGKRIVNRASQ